jgi:hypothetical protein
LVEVSLTRLEVAKFVATFARERTGCGQVFGKANAHGAPASSLSAAGAITDGSTVATRAARRATEWRTHAPTRATKAAKKAASTIVIDSAITVVGSVRA